jgi:threonine dehydrogenase-like Zn-dependent dehydrogenase
MRALVITAPHTAEIGDVPEPVAGPNQVVIDVERVGVCGTDAELFSGEMAYVQSGEMTYPMRIGHEFCGVVRQIGDGVDEALLGRRVIGDVMVGCGSCRRCATGREHLCRDRAEMGVRDGWPGALAEQMLLPVAAVHPLPETLDAAIGAFVEPAGNAYRAVEACALAPGDRVLVIGPGTIGLLSGLIALALELEVHLLGATAESVAFARSIGFAHAWLADELPTLTWDAVIDATNDALVPAMAVDLVEPGGRVVCIGLAGEPTSVDTRQVALKEVSVIGLLGAAPGLDPVIDLFASGRVDPSPLLASTVALDDACFVLAGGRRPDWGRGPKVHIDPREELSK